MERISVKATKTEDFLCKIKYDNVTNQIIDMDCTPMSDMCCKGANKTHVVKKGKVFKTANSAQKK